MAAQQRQVLETTGRLVTQGVQTVDSEEEVVTGVVDIGSQTEKFLVEDKANTEASGKAVGEDVAYSDTSKGTVSVPVQDWCEKPCPEEEIEIDCVREPEHYCVGCAAAFAHLDVSTFDRPCDICPAPTGCAGLRADGPLMTNEELERANLKLPAESQARVPGTSKPKGKELIKGEEWPPAAWEHVDGFEGDDICQDPLRFAVPEFLDETVKLPDICESPTEVQQPVADLCEEFKDLFVLRPGRCTQAEHSVETGTTRPICERIRPIPHKYRDEISALLKEMEELGVIRRSTSAWRFPCVFVPKKNGKVRMCIDYRNLNKACHTEAYPVPRPDDVQEHLAGARVFSTLDLRSGYWQIPVRKEDQRKTAFCPGPGFPLYEWVMMPFGLASAPATFQRLMDAILEHLPFVRVYLDDVLIFSRSDEEHLEHLRIVFELLRAAGMTVAAEKCEFMQDRVTYLGHMFNSTGMSPDLGKAEVILRWPLPRTAPALRSFLGLAGYYRNFVPHFADRSRCLYEIVNYCTKNKVVELGNQWGKEEELAFNDLKQWIASLPLLAYPDFSRPFQLMTDASDVAIGAVVEQDGRPLAFFSQSLTPTQRVWPVYEREAYAVFKALERFRPLLWGYHLELVVFSDHKPLEWIQTATTAKVQRWLISMSQFKFKVFYKKGKHNVVADALSRITTSDDKVAEPDLGALQRELQGTPALVTDKVLTEGREADAMEKDNFAPACVLTLCEQWSIADLVREQELDPVLRVVRDRVRTGEPLAKDELKDLEYRPYRRVWLTLRVHDSGLLVRRVQINEEATSRFVPVVPEGLRRQALDRFHEEAGHFRREHMVARLRRTAYWPGMSKDISEFLLHYEGCAPHKNVLLPHLPYVPYPVGSPWHTVAIDFLAVAPGRSGVSKLLVVVDHFTRWAEAVPVAGESAAEALKALLNLFSIHGPPVRILSDQGSAFESQLFKDVLAQLGIAKSRTSVYHPNANGHVERFNSTILNLLRTHVTRVDSNTIIVSTGYLAGSLTVSVVGLQHYTS
ncbi:retrovirus polyprotein, putative [Perkinsus marinus ATCC 50983]|uniref:Retrovirus polyprotein, putative n=1 Tax=Perkinsus marinus (strain ATCC 50983 / TXsc) TaxID=423536 RepID=C5LBP6_PERM5|nr:retrovirus polyprotein, putative [Perkinsus marinus ATCC 50983]EER05867.1 retrovirus polyprotein, putative [Perkinsus marinus ATCC 50983]|eukprot:XP_002774051.1 retrovirus polyprotein, putative [Perkinsus marinus ATCC 50983]